MGSIKGMEKEEKKLSKKDKIVSIEKKEEDFVDVINKDDGKLISGGIGIFEKVGNVDLYNNGGIEKNGCSVGVM